MMQKLALHHGKILNGEFSLKKLNFLFTFQVNCPGCFIYGFPTVKALYDQFKDEVGFLGLSTAFEDFELNTKENTIRLLDSGELVGETNKYFIQQGYSKHPLHIDLPVAMDKFADDSFDYTKAAINICETNPNYPYWPEFEKTQLQKNVIAYLKTQEKIPLTFTLNQMQGTPTFILFNNEMDILKHHFGHQAIGQLKAELEGLLSQSN